MELQVKFDTAAERLYSLTNVPSFYEARHEHDGDALFAYFQELVRHDFVDEQQNTGRIEAIKSLHDRSVTLESGLDRQKIVDLKFMYSHWYSWRCESSIACINDHSRSIADRLLAVTILRSLHPFLLSEELDPEALKVLPQISPESRTLHELFTESQLPKSMLKLRAYEPHRKFACLPEEWPEDARSFAYKRTEDGCVDFRGIKLRSGDFFVADLAIPHDGLLESFAEELPAYTHAGLFVDYIPKDGGPRIPSVIEIHKKGKRIVPLAAWLSPNFVYLAKAMRLTQEYGDISSSLSKAYQDMPEISYDWQARDPLPGGMLPEGRRCATCTTLGANLMAQVGITFPMPRAQFTKSAIANLTMLGLHSVNDFYSTTNLGLASGLKNIGSIDNRMFVTNFSRYMYIGYPGVPASVGDNMANKTLLPNRLPLSYRALTVEIGLAQRNDMLGKTLQAVAGFKPNQMPNSAPAEVIAFYLVSNNVFSDGILKFAQRDSIRRYTQTRAPIVVSKAICSPAISADRFQIQSELGAQAWYR
jgi:hypothetical protein